MDRVFRRHKTAEVSVLKSRKKFLADKDASQRLKHLKVLIVQLDRTELHQFFHENYSGVFHTFSDAFFLTEYELKQKVNVNNLKELDNLLLIFENILLLLPEYVHQRWQYNCILAVLEELLNERNALSTRKEGIRLFLLWYQILGTNATSKCHQLFTNLVPEFGDLIQEFHKRETLREPGNLNSQATDVVRSHHAKQSFGVQPIELTVLVPPLLVEPFEGNLDVGFELLQHFLQVLVTEVAKVTWMEYQKERHLLQFWFLFEQLKRTYLPLIFPCLSPMYSIYGSSLPKAFGSDSEIANVLRDYPIPINRLSVFQEYFVLWLTKFINSSPRYGMDPFITTEDKSVMGHSGSQIGWLAGVKSSMDDVPIDTKGLSRVVDTIGSPASDSQQFPFDSADPQAVASGARRDTRTDGQRAPNTSHAINFGTNVQQDQTDRRNSTLSQSYPKESSYASPSEITMVCAVLYGCRQNINLLHDILHHAFLLPISSYQALYAVINVYSSWLDDKSTRPIFLQDIDPLDDWNVQPGQNNVVSGLYSPTEDRGHEGDDEAEYPKDSLISGRVPSRTDHAPSFSRRTLVNDEQSVDPPIRSDSDSSSPINATPHGTLSSAVAMKSYQNGTNHTEELRGCFQTTIQVMFDNMSKVFLLRCPPAVQTAVADRPGNLTRYTVDYVRQQVELCRKILRFFRASAISNELSTESWTKLLSTLLEVLNATMVGAVPTDRRINSWLSNEQLIQTLFQTMNVALLRASLFVPISNGPWDQCMAIYSQLTDWPALIIEWRKTMETLTSTMARLVYGVDLANLPDDKKTRYGKRNAAQQPVVRTRPKSFTDAAVNHPTALPSTGVLSQSSVHVTSGDQTGGIPKISPAQYDLPRGSLSVSSNERTRTPTTSQTNVAAAAADWSEMPPDASATMEFASITVDPRPNYTTEEEDSVSLDLNGELGEDEVALHHTGTLLHSPRHSRGLLPRSVAGTPRQDQRRIGHTISDEPNFFSLRRAASDLNEVRTGALDFSPHDPTYGMSKGFTQPNRAALNGGAHNSTTRASVSPDELSVLSIGSVVDRRSRRISLSRSYESPLRKVDALSAQSPSPSAVTASLDDDSSSNISRNERFTSSRTSAEETSDHVMQPPSTRALGSSPRSNSGDAGYSGNHEPVILPDSIRPTSRYLHRGDTLTADSLPRSFPVDSTQTPTKSRICPKPIPTLSDSGTPRCIMAGGLACGWTAESVVVCWRRFFGILGRINSIKDKENLDRIYAYFADLTTVLLKIREHQLLGPVSENCVQPTPNYVVPVEFILPTLFEALQIPNHPESVKVTAIRILGDAVIRPADGKFDEEVLSQFYLMLHRVLTGFEERYIREVIRACAARFFGSGLPGAHLLLLDFLRGAALVLGDPSGVTDTPRSQALLMYTSLLCYPHHFGSFESLEPNSPTTFKLTTCHDLKQKLLQALTQATWSDPNAEARCLALTALAMHCVIELIHLHTDNSTTRSMHVVSSQNNFVIDALVVLLGMMRFQDHSVALVAVEMVTMLADSCELLLKFLPRYPVLIIRSIAWTLRLLWQSSSSNKLPIIDKRLLVSLVVSLVEWTLRLPRTLVRAPIERINGLSSADDQQSTESALSLVLSTLHAVVCYPPSSLGIKTGTDESAAVSGPDSLTSFPDPLLDCLSDCQTRIEVASFSAPKSRLDGSSLARKSFLMTDHGHPWVGLQSTGEDPYSNLQSVRLAARVALCQVLNYLDHFPMDPQGALLNTCIQENHDQIESCRVASPRSVIEKELSSEILESTNTQLFVINDSVLVSFLSLPTCASAANNPLHRVIHACSKSDKPSIPVADDVPAGGGGGESATQIVGLTDLFPLTPVARRPSNATQSKLHTHSAVSDSHYTRIIVRDFSGKYSWDLSCLYGLWNGPIAQTRSQSVPCTGSDGTETRELVCTDSRSSIQSARNPPPCPPPRLNPNPPPLAGVVSNSPTLSSECSDQNGMNGPLGIEDVARSGLPEPTSSTDALRSLLLELTSTSPECSITWAPTPPGASDRSDPASCLNTPCFNMEALTGDQITAQCQLDTEVIELRSTRRAVSPASDTDIPSGQSTVHVSPTSTVFDPFSQWSVYCGQFAVARHLFNQLGFLSWERRRTVELVQKSAGLVRDLKHLDKLGARETHKIAVFYVGAGQEDKQSILSNQTASLEFENFVSGLGWEIDLRTHRGFRGGLERSGRAGDSTPYYATATVEAIFHVSTRMPSSTQEDLKYKHLGNDEVMIIWTENARAFSRSMLRTQFGDVLIIISPLPTGLFRVEVRRESDVGFFGPIVHSAILDGFVLPALVRATAINASRAIRTMKPGYRAHYEERAASLKQLITQHALPTCFEAFTESLFLPSTSLDSASSPPPNAQPTDSVDMVSSARTQDFPIEPASNAPTTLPASVQASSTNNTVSLRAGPVAKDSAQSWSQYHMSFVDNPRNKGHDRSRKDAPALAVRSAAPAFTTDSSTDSARVGVSHNAKRHSRHHNQHSSVDRAYGGRLQFENYPPAVNNINHPSYAQPNQFVPPTHHLRHLLPHKSRRRP